jgi:hypothetical protein
VHRQTADASNLLAHRPATRSTYGAGWASRCRFSSGNPIDRAETPMLGSVPDAQQSGSILSQFGFIRRGDVELALRRMGATIGIPPIYPTEIASNYRGKSSNRCGYSLTTGFFDKKLPSEPPSKPRTNSDTPRLSGLSVLSGRLATGARDKYRTKKRGRQRVRIQSRFRLGSSETQELFSFI